MPDFSPVCSAVIIAIAAVSLAFSLVNVEICSGELCPGKGREHSRHRILFITLEFVDPIFSGNGVLSRTVVRSLAGRNHKVLVICAAPEGAQGLNSSTYYGADVVAVPVPAEKWLRLDRHSSWQDFSSSIRTLLPEIEDFNPSILMAVDWSGWNTLAQITGSPSLMDRPALYLPFRVFSQSAELVATAQDRHFYLDQECAAVQGSTGIVALSFYDKRRLELLQELCSQSLRPGGFPLETCALAGSESSDYCEAKAGQSHKHQHSNIAVLWPPVRSDILSIGRSLMQQSLRVSGWAKWNWQENRRFITCCVRLSREKNAMLFADLAKEMSAFLQNHGLAFRLCGAAADKDYALAVKSRLAESGVQVEVWEKFSSARELTKAFTTSLLNIHPSLHDAFGMTVLEAATVATPTLLHDSQAVGVGEVFSSDEVFRYNFSSPVAEIAEYLQLIVRQRLRLAQVGRRAQRRALSFDLLSYQDKLAGTLQSLVK